MMSFQGLLIAISETFTCYSISQKGHLGYNHRVREIKIILCILCYWDALGQL